MRRLSRLRPLVLVAALLLSPRRRSAGERDEPLRPVRRGGCAERCASAADRASGDRGGARRAEGRRLARALPAAPRHGRDVRPGEPDVDGARLVGRRGRDRARGRDRPGRARHRGVDGPAGRVEDGTWAAWRVRRRGAHLLARLGGALGALRPRSRGSPPTAVAPDARPARARLVRRLPRLLQPRRGLPERRPERPAARLPPRAHGLGRLPARDRTRPWHVAAPALAGVVARRRDALPARLPDRLERRGGAARDRRRLRGRDRRRPDPRRSRAVRRDARRGEPHPVR